MQIIHVLYIIPCAHKNKENLKTNTYTYINIAIIFYCSFVQLTKHNVRWRCSSWSSLTNLHNYFQQICISLILIKMQEKKGNNFNEWNGYGWKNCEYIKCSIVLFWDDDPFFLPSIFILIIFLKKTLKSIIISFHL